jgi:cell division protein FtsB
MQNVNFPVFSYLRTRKKELDKATERIAKLEAEVDRLNDELIRQRNIITKAQRLLKQL